MRLDTFTLFVVSLFFLHTVSAHYVFSTLITSSGSSSAPVRKPTTNSPVHDLTSSGATCNVQTNKATDTSSVAAGSVIGFQTDPGVTVFHVGPGAMYLGKAPGSAADWDGSGQNWFKIAEWGATFNPFNWTSLGKTTFTTNIPASVPSGEYLVRMEHIALHITGSPELYVSCAQVKITNGGSGNPTKVSIPGYVAKDDPMLMLNVYYPVPTAYTVPGPSVYSDTSGGSASGGSTSGTPNPKNQTQSPKKSCRPRLSSRHANNRRRSH